MNKYKKLLFNILVFAVGSFSSKIFALLLNKLYTRNIDPAGFYTKSLIETIALFLVPVFTFSLTEAIVRFGLDGKFDRRRVFTTAACFILGGLTVMLLFVPLLPLLPFLRPLRGYTFLLGIYVWTSALRALCSQFARSRELVRIFSFDGIATTVTLFIFSLIFISFMGMGVEGFMLATILSDGFSALFMFLAASIRRYFKLKWFDKELGRKMLRFSVPLIPTTVMWTLTGFSDQIFISNMHSTRVELGETAAGIYSTATKVPNLLSMAATIFAMAWNMSAIMENRSKGKQDFYRNVFDVYQSVLFLGAAGLIFLVRPLSGLLISYDSYGEYSRAYLYTPILIVAAVYVCLNHFEYGIYTAAKRSRGAMYTVAASLCSNLLLNAVMIPLIGIQGASLATCFSYIICFTLRMMDIRQFAPFGFSMWKLCVNTALLMIMSLTVIVAEQDYMTFCALPAVIIFIINFGALKAMLRQLTTES